MTRSVLALSALTILTLQAQPSPEFEVATARAVDMSKLGNAINMNLGTVQRETLTFGNATLNDCIRFAYNMASDFQIVAPDWVKSKEVLYDIVAKGAPGSSREQLQAMMRTLLAERFKLVVHKEQKEMSHFALIPAKNGPKIQQVKEIPDGFRNTNFGGRINSILPIPMLAYLLSRFENERPIIDLTGLSGLYQIKLEWALSGRAQKADDPPPGPSLVTALTEQLGLRMEARKGPVEVLVVDSAEKTPSEN